MQPPYLAEKLPELSDSEAKQAFQLVFIKHSVFAMQNNSIISALLWLDVTKLRSSKQPSPARLAAFVAQQSLSSIPTPLPSLHPHPLTLPPSPPPYPTLHPQPLPSLHPHRLTQPSIPNPYPPSIPTPLPSPQSWGRCSDAWLI